LGPGQAGVEVCFTLSRSDGTLYTTSDQTQCHDYVPGDTAHTYRWENLTAGTYQVEETINGPYAPMSPNPATGIAVTSERKAVVRPTIVNRLPPVTLRIRKWEEQVGLPWTGPAVSFRIYACPDGDCTSLGDPIATVVIPDSTPISLAAGRYLVREMVPDGYVAEPGEQEVMVTAGQDATLDFVNREVVGTEGCSPGYWKNHVDAWAPLGVDSGDSFNETFDTDYRRGDITLLEAINLGGGGFSKLARHGVAAYLNALSDISYPYSAAEVIAMVQAGEAGELAASNDLHCPLN
jgi:hypothetical protein